MKHPYQTLEKHAVWKLVDKAVSDLVANGDLNEMTARPYIVGYICKQLVESEVVVAAIKVRRPRQRS